MKRPEFSRRTKLQAWDRCGGHCEKCGRKIRPGDGPEYDHLIPAELSGTADLDNCQVLCRWCHAEKTADDAHTIAKGRKVRARHANANTPKRQLPGGKGSRLKRKIGGGWVER